jgi:hypothetical protein
MNKIQETFVQALLTDAAYVDNLHGDTGYVDGLDLRMTPFLGAVIRANFKVVTQINTSDESGSGFDATVWRGTQGDNLDRMFVTMRGSEGLNDFTNDVLLSTPMQIAYFQVVDMIDWWRRITSPVGTPIVSVTGNNQVGTGELVGVSNVTVTGHSLGGHLAAAFARLFGRSVSIDAVATFNSAGFAPGSGVSFAPLEAFLGPAVSLGRFFGRVAN